VSRKDRPSERRTMDCEQFEREELPHLAEVLSFGNSHQSSVYADSTGVKSPEVVFRGLFLSQNRLVSEEYLLNYRRNTADMSLLIGVGNYGMPMTVGAIAARRIVPRADRLRALPNYDPLKAPIGSVIRSRRSGRQYSGRPITEKELSTMLFYAQGETGELETNLPPTVTLGDTRALALRAAPSGGGLHPIYLYFVATHVESFEPGLYRYVPHGHAVELVTPLAPDFDLTQLGSFAEMDHTKIAILFLYVYHFYENARKYGDLGLSFALLESGAIAENIHLTCTALGLGSCDIGGIKKRACEKLVDLDSLSEHVIHMTVAGK